MGEDNSIFVKMGDNQFKKYCKYALKVLEKVATRRLDNTDLKYFEMIVWEVMDKLKSPLGNELNRLDIEYLYATLALNKLDFSEDKDIIRPELTFENIDYIVEENVVVRTVRSGKIPTYADWAIYNQQYLFTLWNEYNVFDPWEWNVTDKDELDWSLDSEEFSA